MRYRPSPSVVTERVAPVAAFLMVTITPGSTALVVSRIVPDRVPVAV